MKFKFILIGIIVIFFSCARRGRPEGGPLDESKPIMVKTIPEFKSIHFNTDEIKIYFDEFIKLKELSSNLIVSPPLKYPPIITPQGTPSKKITIRIIDTLLENTTYTFNFGQSVIDNTEGNILDNFKYIFSTGDYIDSLEVKGTIKDAFELKMIENPTIMLYEADDGINDSIIFKEKPMYIGSTIDSINWDITNIKAGKYLLIALNDYRKNYKFNPKEDKIGFHSKIINVPTDSTYHINLFSEIFPFKIPTRPKEISKGHIIIGYEGMGKDLKIDEVSKVPDNFRKFLVFDRERDTLHYWYKNYETDSILLSIKNKSFSDTLKIRLSAKEMDSLEIKTSISSILHLNDTLKLLSNVPIEKIDTSRIELMGKDSIPIEFSVKLSADKEFLSINFKKQNPKGYILNVFPGAVTDFFGLENDTIKRGFSTQKTSNYGFIYLKLKNVKSYPIIVELINDKGEVVVKSYARKPQEFEFKNLIPSRYMVRIIYDTNENKKWDTGDFLSKKQPEEVYYFNNIINVKANWVKDETIIMQ